MKSDNSQREAECSTMDVDVRRDNGSDDHKVSGGMNTQVTGGIDSQISGGMDAHVRRNGEISQADELSLSIPHPSIPAESTNLAVADWTKQTVFCLIGLLLSFTALAKLWMLLTDTFADVRISIPKEILWLTVGFELWLAFENFRAALNWRDWRVMAFANTIVFAALGIFAGFRWAMGYQSCGCSGSFELPGWIFIGIDVCGSGVLCDAGCQSFAPPAGANGTPCVVPAGACINSTATCKLGCACIKSGATLCQCNN